MAYLLPGHKSMLMRGSLLAERIISRETRWSGDGHYDVVTLSESGTEERCEGTFAHLLMLGHEDESRPPLFRVCLQDIEICEFLQSHPDVDLISFFTFIMTHELIHIHRFSTGMADFFATHKADEEVFVDSLTRLLLTKYPLTGLKNVLALLDKVEAAPLYSLTKVVEQGRIIHAYL